MTYKCPKCSQVSEEAGNCSNCNVPMNEEVAPVNGETTPETSQPQESPDSEEQK